MNFALGPDVKDLTGRSVMQLCFEREDQEEVEVVPICALTPYKSEQFSTCIELDAGKEYAFEVVSDNDVHLIGNYIGDHSTGPQVTPFEAPKSVKASSILVPQPVSSTAHEDSSRSIHDNKDLPAFVDKDPFKMDGSLDSTPHTIVIEEIVGQGELNTHCSCVVLYHMCKLHPGDITLDRSTTADGPPSEVTVGLGHIPKAWDQHIIGMNDGGSHVIDIPPHLINMDEWEKHLTGQGCHKGVQRLSEVNPQKAHIIVHKYSSF
ncbi:uncharacterized protein LACBIDRAFT_298696 [Laccaria bicolor S238N-H82]|uniref:Predicted protein n=1 Tax=Laccaria bicolor (strain S238N-H82 / ATCC MYA-4686) TaxID=486041 RepID=B0DDF6_LACBS|nr:uncharacterized protein LACBIDRAFT_298696 [Laccaria bicolor S238N-H82]EDR07468.1 predicted protein [Laccaria bicolor S238N-H82]|eukprot:XP_001881860.1 predicted protein [Laccaria bicolor S238N-H82]